MKPRHKRAAIIAGGLAALSLAAFLVLNAFESNLVFFFSPSQVASGEAPKNRTFRVGGMVKEGSVERKDLTVSFIVTDTAQEMKVTYTGILPDLFRENQAVIATGRREGDEFIATQVLAKHDEQYMPQDVADAMGKAHEKHKVEAAPAGEAKPGGY